MPRIFVALSGGIDSTTCLAMAVKRFGARNIAAISFDYGQTHRVELDAARRVSDFYGVRHSIMELALGMGGLSDPSAVIPNVGYSELKGVSPSYVPFRNGNIISQLASIAAAKMHLDHASIEEPNRIYIGAHAEDAAGGAYPDCTMHFVGAMAAAVNIGTYGMVMLEAPLINMVKHEIIQAAADLAAPLHLTRSCYSASVIQCGICPTCRARKEGFKAANVMDPTTYQVPA